MFSNANLIAFKFSQKYGFGTNIQKLITSYLCGNEISISYLDSHRDKVKTFLVKPFLSLFFATRCSRRN